MWTEPRHTVRSIVHIAPSYGFWVLATLYALASSFFFAHVYSWGLETSFLPIFLPLLILSPVIGFVWLSFDAWILYRIGLLLKGKAHYPAVRAAVAWAKIPFFIALAMWVALAVINPDIAFIQYVSGMSAFFIFFITSVVNVWAAVLLIQSVREVQLFPLGRAIANVFLGWIISFCFSLILLIISRYIYLSSV